MYEVKDFVFAFLPCGIVILFFIAITIISLCRKDNLTKPAITVTD